MARSSRPRKPHRAKRAGDLPTRFQLWRLETIFGVLEELLRHLAQGGLLDETAAGELLYVSRKDNQLYPVVDYVRTYAQFFAIARSRDPACPDPAPLHAVAHELAAGQIDSVTVDAALACCMALRTYAGSKPPGEMRDVAYTVEIKLRMAELND